MYKNKANLRDYMAGIGLVILLKLDLDALLLACVTLKSDDLKSNRVHPLCYVKLCP